jgi:predicted nucleic acid-binding protein
MRIYLDICAIQRPLDEQSQLRIRLETEAVLGVLAASASGLVEFVTSDVHYVETARNPHPNRRDFALEVLGLASEQVEVSEAVASRAADYTQAGLDAPDALHLAAAVEAEVDFFCTTDDRLASQSHRVNTQSTAVVSPLELVSRLDQP